MEFKLKASHLSNKLAKESSISFRVFENDLISIQKEAQRGGTIVIVNKISIGFEIKEKCDDFQAGEVLSVLKQAIQKTPGSFFAVSTHLKKGGQRIAILDIRKRSHSRINLLNTKLSSGSDSISIQSLFMKALNDFLFIGSPPSSGSSNSSPLLFLRRVQDLLFSVDMSLKSSSCEDSLRPSKVKRQCIHHAEVLAALQGISFIKILGGASVENPRLLAECFFANIGLFFSTALQSFSLEDPPQGQGVTLDSTLNQKSDSKQIIAPSDPHPERELSSLSSTLLLVGNSQFEESIVMDWLHSQSNDSTSTNLSQLETEYGRSLSIKQFRYSEAKWPSKGEIDSAHGVVITTCRRSGNMDGKDNINRWNFLEKAMNDLSNFSPVLLILINTEEYDDVVKSPKKERKRRRKTKGKSFVKKSTFFTNHRARFSSVLDLTSEEVQTLLENESDETPRTSYLDELTLLLQEERPPQSSTSKEEIPEDPSPSQDNNIAKPENGCTSERQSGKNDEWRIQEVLLSPLGVCDGLGEGFQWIFKEADEIEHLRGKRRNQPQKESTPKSPIEPRKVEALGLNVKLGRSKGSHKYDASLSREFPVPFSRSGDSCLFGWSLSNLIGETFEASKLKSDQNSPLKSPLCLSITFERFGQSQTASLEKPTTIKPTSSPDDFIVKFTDLIEIFIQRGGDALASFLFHSMARAEFSFLWDTVISDTEFRNALSSIFSPSPSIPPQTRSHPEKIEISSQVEHESEPELRTDSELITKRMDLEKLEKELDERAKKVTEMESAFQLRYFVVKGPDVCYFVDDQEKKFKGKIICHGCKAFVDEKLTTEMGEAVIKVETLAKKDFFLICEKQDEKWLEVFRFLSQGNT